jgi:hypothetical protein
MFLILLEALAALALLLLIVWWTMFAGRDNGELPKAAGPTPTEPAAGVGLLEPEPRSRDGDAP